MNKTFRHVGGYEFTVLRILSTLIYIQAIEKKEEKTGGGGGREGEGGR